jgi:predicted oxidoreductase
MDLLVEKRIRPMIWSPLAGGKIFTSDDLIYKKTREKIQEVAKRYSAQMDTVIYSWIMQHPAGAIPICGSHNLERLDSAIAAFDLKLSHDEWFEIYLASGQNVLR